LRTQVSTELPRHAVTNDLEEAAMEADDAMAVLLAGFFSDNEDDDIEEGMPGGQCGRPEEKPEEPLDLADSPLEEESLQVLRASCRQFSLPHAGLMYSDDSDDDDDAGIRV
jgi:hypothetical protein